MNRRNFFSTLATAAAGFTILPGAGRVWRATRQPMTSCEFAWSSLRYTYCLSDEYVAAFKAIMARHEMQLNHYAPPTHS